MGNTFNFIKWEQYLYTDDKEIHIRYFELKEIHICIYTYYNKKGKSHF